MIPNTIQALVQPEAASENLTLSIRPTPVPSTDSEHLIKVICTSPCSGELRWVKDHLERKGPQDLIPCYDLAGVVVTAPASSPFRVGDEVYGRTDFSRSGNAREYTIGLTTELALRPKNLSWAESAAVPLSALTAWQALFKHSGHDMQSIKGKRILITAAAGGVGSWAVQLASLAGAQVIGTCGPRNIDFVRSLGATDVVDYMGNGGTQERTQDGRTLDKVDIILDCAGGKSLEDAWLRVGDGGVLFSIVQPPESLKPAGWNGKDVKSLFFIMEPDGHALANITKLLEDGKCRSVLDSVCPLKDFKEVFRKLEEGHVRGKIVFDMMSIII